MPMYVAQGGPVADIESASPGQPASWLTHVAVTSLDESRAKVESLGGSIVLPERAIPGVGRLSLITDPDGALLSIFEASR
jgi:predicted enzyme related to lactoylglutathione lyase